MHNLYKDSENISVGCQHGSEKHQCWLSTRLKEHSRNIGVGCQHGSRNIQKDIVEAGLRTVRTYQVPPSSRKQKTRHCINCNCTLHDSAILQSG